jgi:hypothetical protein
MIKEMKPTYLGKSQRSYLELEHRASLAAPWIHLRKIDKTRIWYHFGRQRYCDPFQRISLLRKVVGSAM